MMASAAQIANDMAAHAAYWSRRDKRLSALCRDAAAMINDLSTGQKVDGRTFRGLHDRLLREELSGRDRRLQGYPNIHRARLVMDRLIAERMGT